MIKSLVIIGAIMLGVAGGAMVGQKVTVGGVINQVADYPNTVPTPTMAPPAELIIPKLRVDTPIETVGLTASGDMDIPKVSSDAGWYDLGPKPGEIGNSVIDGHLDWYSGPEIFYHLNQLIKGDLIEVRTTDGKLLKFTVTNKASFDDASFPIETVFGPVTTKSLNLITCDGVFNHQTKNYSKRLVVFSQLVE